MVSASRRVDEEGERALIRLPVPVNKYPHFVRYIVCQLKLFFPAMGKARIARVLARAGLHLGVTTVGRILKSDEPLGDVVEQVLPDAGPMLGRDDVQEERKRQIGLLLFAAGIAAFYSQRRLNRTEFMAIRKWEEQQDKPNPPSDGHQ